MTRRDFIIKTAVATNGIIIANNLCANQTASEITNNNSEWQNFSFSCKKIYDNGKHCAFTSMTKFNGDYYIAFREAETHIFDKDGIARGGIRILKSKNAQDWDAVAFMQKEGYDLRDPKLSVTPDNCLMVLCGGSVYVDKKRISMIPQVCFSANGSNFSDMQSLNLKFENKSGKDWLWKVTWHKNVGYGIMYYLISENPPFRKAVLVKTIDGLNYEEITNLNIPDCPGEATIRFLSDNRMVLVITNGLPSDKTEGVFGISKPPYTNWDLKNIGMKLGGPDLIVHNDKLILATRSSFLPKSKKTLLLCGDINGNFNEVMFLPSGGDNSYPGLLIENNELWCSYYSSHETKPSSIYLAKIPLTAFEK